MKKTLLFFCVLSIFLFTSFNRYQPVSLEIQQPTTKQVEIKGEVLNPGVYTVKIDASVNDVIELAGGLNEMADTSTISLVKEVENNEVIVVPKYSEETNTLISINTASLEELETLPGIGPALAQRIIDYRSETSFTSLEDIKNVKGIGDKLFLKIQEYICL